MNMTYAKVNKMTSWRLGTSNSHFSVVQTPITFLSWCDGFFLYMEINLWPQTYKELNHQYRIVKVFFYHDIKIIAMLNWQVDLVDNSGSELLEND